MRREQPRSHQQPVGISTEGAAAQQQGGCPSPQVSSRAARRAKGLLAVATSVRQELSEGKAAAGCARWLPVMQSDILDMAHGFPRNNLQSYLWSSEVGLE